MAIHYKVSTQNASGMLAHANIHAVASLFNAIFSLENPDQMPFSPF